MKIYNLGTSFAHSNSTKFGSTIANYFVIICFRIDYWNLNYQRTLSGGGINLSGIRLEPGDLSEWLDDLRCSILDNPPNTAKELELIRRKTAKTHN